MTALVLLCNIAAVNAENLSGNLTIVPYPQTVDMQSGTYNLPDNYKVSAPKEFADLAALIVDDLGFHTGLSGKKVSGNADIMLVKDETMPSEEYRLAVDGDGVTLTAPDYQSMSYAVTSLLQMTGFDGSLAKVVVTDSPVREYRGLMLDVARQWIEFETLKQCVDLARWYKIKTVQLHLSDDQSFTFESKAFPDLATPGRHYTQKQLRELVEYARVRGVTVFPEFDLPGHSTEMRRRMPDVFGESRWGVIDIADDRTVEAVKTVAKEMMDVFSAAPYFHIGADECWFGEYQKLDHVKKAVKEKGFDNVHDLYLEFIVKMYDFVKENGKQPLAWESFQGKGSRHVTIPEDLLMFAWETAYRTPQSLLANGFTIINASWKPMYVVPGWRWSPEYIYNFGMTRWENHWSVTPAYQNPIRLDPETTPVLGGQMCAWEMDDPAQVQTLHTRLAAVSEAMWNDGRQRPFEYFEQAFASVDGKIMNRIFPVREIRSGFKSPCSRHLDENRVNTFCSMGKVEMKPLDPSHVIRYTTDGSMPTSSSDKLDSVLEITRDAFVKYGVFDRKGRLVGYHSVKYRFCPIDAVNLGDVKDPRDVNICRQKKIFSGRMKVALKNGCPGTVLRYTVDGSAPVATSPEYKSPVPISSTTELSAQCFDGSGKAVGNGFKCTYVYRDFEDNVTTGKCFLEQKNGEIADSAEGFKAVDGEVDIDTYWGSRGPASAIVDLGNVTNLQAINLFTFWDGRRYYQYTVDVSVDGKDWKQVVDRSENTEKSVPDGQLSFFDETPARYVRVNMLRNSANPAVHIVEIRLY